MECEKELLEEVWNKAINVSGYDSNVARKDCCGAWILRSEFGNRNSDFGWEIDHVYPKSKGGGDELDNLRPMHWRNNLAKGDDFPIYNVAVQADGMDNVYYDTTYKVCDTLTQKLEKLYKTNKCI